MPKIVSTNQSTTMATNTYQDKRSDINVKLDKPNWLKVDEDDYQVDHVINAYVSGKESAFTDLARTVERQRDEVLAEGIELTDKFLNML